MCGLDVYTSEVDDKGIDFVIRKGEEAYYDVQVKSLRGLGYIFFPKANFKPRRNLLAVIVLFTQGEPPESYLIPSTAWLQPNALLRSRDYVGKESKPEWGINVSKKNLPLLTHYTLRHQIQNL